MRGWKFPNGNPVKENLNNSHKKTGERFLPFFFAIEPLRLFSANAGCQNQGVTDHALLLPVLFQLSLQQVSQDQP